MVNLADRAPSPPGFDATLSEPLARVARLVVEAHGAAPCAVVAAARRQRGSWLAGAAAAGRLWHEPTAPAATVATCFDLASLTKPLTALALARLERAGRVDRRALLGSLLPALGDTPAGRCPLDLLAAHRAGLDGHRELFIARLGVEQRPRAELERLAACARRAEVDGAPPPDGFSPEYSDLGYLLLGAALEQAGGAALDELVAAEVTRPLDLAIGSARQLGSRAGGFDRFVVAVAPTEVVAWRGGLVRGVVHDENAWVLVGDGLAGHAGAFGDAPSVLRLGMALVETLAGERASWLTADELRPAIRERPGGSLGAGFDRRSGPEPSSGARFGRATFGHLGFTGTSLWVDPDAALVGVLLSNRVHPTRDNVAIRRARPAAYDALYDIMMSR